MLVLPLICSSDAQLCRALQELCYILAAWAYEQLLFEADAYLFLRAAPCGVTQLTSHSNHMHPFMVSVLQNLIAIMTGKCTDKKVEKL